MSIHSLVDGFKIANGRKAPTVAQAKKLASCITSDMCLRDGIYIDSAAISPLKKAFPQFKWRVAEDRTGEYKFCFVTILEDDPREHYRQGPGCPRCGKNHMKEIET